MLIKWMIASHRAGSTGWSLVQFFLSKQPLSDVTDDLPSHRSLSVLWYWIRSDRNRCFYCNLLTWLHLYDMSFLPCSPHDHCRHTKPPLVFCSTLNHITWHKDTVGIFLFFTCLRSWLVRVLRDPVINNCDRVNSALSCAAKVSLCGLCSTKL